MHNNKLVFIAACLGLFLFGMVAVTLGSVLPEIVEKFDVNELQAGLLTSLLPIGYLIGSLLFGPIADRYGYKWLFVICCLVILLSLEGLAFGNAWWMIQLSVLIIGCGGGALNGATSGVVADISDESNRSSRLSTLGVFYGLGAILMPMILAVLAGWFSREMIFAGIGFFVFLLIIYLWTVTFPAPKQSEGIDIREVLQLIKSKALLFLAFYLLFQSGIESVINSWITSFLQAQPKVQQQMALLALTIHMTALTGARIILSRLLKLYSGYYMLLISYCLILAGSILMWLYPGYTTTLIALVLMGCGFAGGFPIILGQVATLWSKMSGTAFSIVLTITLMGGISLSYLMGVVAHEFSIAKLPSLLLATVGCLGLATLNLRAIFRK